MRRVYLATLLSALLVFLIYGTIYSFGDKTRNVGVLKVGFIYENDEITPYTYNFSLGAKALEREYPGKVEVMTRSNVLDEETEEPLRELIHSGCSIIFTDSYTDALYKLAPEFPDVQFCQASSEPLDFSQLPENYHTFKGRIVEGRYVSGIAAGMKLNEMIDNHVIDAEDALVGFVAAHPIPEVISSYTAFLLGVRSVCPTAVMNVRYTYTWGNYSLEKSTTKTLIDEGCQIIGQYCDTVGPALACEEASHTIPIYHVGYNKSMIDVAPSSSLISTCVNWTPYIVEATEAVMNNSVIEEYVEGDVNGNDMCAGFERGWVEILEPNSLTIARGTQDAMDTAIEAFKKGKIDIYKGNYTGVNPNDGSDTIDLRNGYKENSTFSSPSFHYVLRDIIHIEN